MSKLSFRARALDAFKNMPIYLTEEVPDLPEYSAINRAVPAMPSGMDEEEECEHHFQRAIVTGLIIPTPEVTKAPDFESLNKFLTNAPYKPPKQLIRMQPFPMEEDYPDYDMDSEDEKWLSKQKLEITPLKFEEMMDRLEKNCAQNFASQDRKELLLKDDDELSIAIYDYWLSKRLKTPQPLVPSVRTKASRFGGTNNNNNPYLAFRRITEKMQTRKNRKNDEASYEKMIKLKRDLSRALHLLELVKRREILKRELLQLTVDTYEKRYQANDLSGQLLAELSAAKPNRPAFAPIYTNQYTGNHTPSWQVKPPKEELGLNRKEKRHYKKRKHKAIGVLGPGVNEVQPPSSGDEDRPLSPAEQVAQAFPFQRNKQCQYQAPHSGGKIGNWRWCSEGEGGSGEERFRYSLTSLRHPQPRCIGLARRRLGRGGRVILDRAGGSMDQFWSSVDFKILENAQPSNEPLFHFRPKTPPKSPPVICEDFMDVDSASGSTLSLQVESPFEPHSSTVELNLNELFPDLDMVNLKQDIFGGGDSDFSSSSGGLSPSVKSYMTISSSSSGGRRSSSVYSGGSLLERLVEVVPSPIHLTSPSSNSSRFLSSSPSTSSISSQETIGSSSVSSTERSRTRLVNSKLDNVQFVLSESELSSSSGTQYTPVVATPPQNYHVPPLACTNGPSNPSQSDCVGFGWLQNSSSNLLPLLIKNEGSSLPVSISSSSSSLPQTINSKLPVGSRSPTRIINSEGNGGGNDENIIEKHKTGSSSSLVNNSHLMEVT